MNAIFALSIFLISYAGRMVSSVPFPEDVRGEVLEDRTRERLDDTVIGRGAPTELHPVELLQALVELVVPDARDVEPERVQRVDRRLVGEETGDERRGADQVTRADGDRVRVGRPETLEVRREVLDAPAGTVFGVHAVLVEFGTQQPTWIVPGVFGSRWP